MYAIAQKSSDFAANHQSLSSTRTRSVSHVFHRQRRRVWWPRMRRQRCPDGVILHWTCDGDRAHGFSHFQHFTLSEPSNNFRLLGFRRAVQDSVQAFDRRVIHFQLHKKPVELCLGEWISTFHLQRILCGQYEERRIQFVCPLADGYAAFFHRLEQRRLGFGGGSIDLVRQQDVRKDGPRLEIEEFFAHGVLLNDVRTCNIGRHEIGCELNSRELQVHDIRESRDQFRLSQSGYAFE